jgi:hypothetical protein
MDRYGRLAAQRKSESADLNWRVGVVLWISVCGTIAFPYHPLILCRPSYTPPLHSPSFPPFPLLIMMYHSAHPLPSPLVHWGPSCLDVPAFAKPDPSWFDYPSNPHPPRRRPYHRLGQSVASSSMSRPLHPHSSRVRANLHSQPHPLRAQAAPALSALPALPLSLPMPGLEREYSSCTRSDLHLRGLSASAVSLSDPRSPMSTAAPPTPAPGFLHVVCNAPLLAPKPLPYRPPAFLDNFELPDPDEDLSHPPYTRSSSKRRRTQDGQDDLAVTSSVSKRRATETVLRGLNGIRSHRRFSK